MADQKNNNSFEYQGKVFLISLLLVYLNLSFLLDSFNPVEWPGFMKPMLLILTFVVAGVSLYVTRPNPEAAKRKGRNESGKKAKDKEPQ